MITPIIELLNVLIVGAIVFLFWREGRKRNLSSINGWNLILTGIVLIFFGVLLDLSDNFAPLAPFIIIGPTPIEAFLEKAVGYLGGFAFTATGLWQWLPMVLAHKETIDSKVKWQNTILTRISRAQSQFILEKNASEVFGMLLEDLLAVSSSEYGFMGEILSTPDGEPYLHSPATVNISWDEESRKFYDDHALDGMEFHNINTLFGAVMTSQNLVISNDPTNDPRIGGLPDGHPQMNTFLGIPFFSQGKIVGMAGIANRPGGYDNELVHDLTPFISTCANIVTAHRANRERRRFEEQLRGSERRYRQIIEEAVDIIFRFDPLGYCTMVNKRAEKLTGYSHDELIGRLFTDLITPDWRDRVQDHYLKQRNDLIRESTMEFPIVTKLGEIKWVEQTVMLNMVDGEINSLDGIVRDINERKQAEEALAKSESELRHLYENSQEGIFRTTPDGEFLFANPALAKMLGYKSVDEFIKTNAADHYESADQRDNEINKYDDQGHVDGVELELVRKNGTKIWVRSFSTTEKDEDGNVKWYEGIMSDITESRRLKEEILKSQKLESVGQLAGGLAHDFNNVLATIQLQTDSASLVENAPEAVKETLKNIERSVSKATAITQQLLTFSKGGAPVKVATDIGRLIQESVLFGLSGANLSPRFEIERSLHTSEVDQNQISQVVSKLVINAQDAMPEGGEISIAVKNVAVTHTNQVGPLKHGRYISVSIADQGHGIEPAILNNIFDPYFTTKQEGSGLGLFSCYSIISKHAGWITAESKVGKGSVFTFYLPESTESLREQTVKIAQPKITKGTGNILIMDDNNDLRDVLAKLLRSLGYSSSNAADGEEAIRLYSDASKAGTPFDLVILDLTVPNGLGGAATIKRLLAFDSNVKAIVSSGYSNNSVIADYKAHGFSAVLPKPYTLGELAAVAKDIIDG